MTDKLKPCPFCGGEVKLMAIAGEPYPPTYEVELDKITKDSDDICYVHCPTCGANWHKEVRIESFPLDTIEAWNTRKPMDEIVEQLEAIEVSRCEYSETMECNIEPCTHTSCYECIVNKAIEIVKGGVE